MDLVFDFVGVAEHQPRYIAVVNCRFCTTQTHITRAQIMGMFVCTMCVFILYITVEKKREKVSKEYRQTKTESERGFWGGEGRILCCKCSTMVQPYRNYLVCILVRCKA